MPDLFAFPTLSDSPLLSALSRLETALSEANALAARAAYRDLYLRLTGAEHPDLATAIASGLLYSDSSLARAAMTGEVAGGLLAGARYDLLALLGLVRRDLPSEMQTLLGESLPPLTKLAPDSNDVSVRTLWEALWTETEEGILEHLLRHYRQHGAGVLGRYRAYHWTGERLEGITHPAEPDMTRLVGLERPLGLLQENTEAFLKGKPAQHVLLYGSRGSGKSTAVRSLLPRYVSEGLRLVELSVARLTDLPRVIEGLRPRPHPFILFVDDLAFEAQDAGYAPLKTLLEGSLTEKPANVLVYATSNRRHLVKERFADRPDPLDDDVHAWDTQNERLALADRFGLTITFPSATQARYLEIVRGLAQREGLVQDDLDAKAVRYADWGNGYSGRTAQQFIDSLKREMA